MARKPKPHAPWFSFVTLARQMIAGCLESVVERLQGNLAKALVLASGPAQAGKGAGRCIGYVATHTMTAVFVFDPLGAGMRTASAPKALAGKA